MGRLRAWLAGAALAVPLVIQAATVQVIGLGPARAELLVNGSAVRSLRPGQTSPEGVTLVAIAGSRAIVETEGRRHELGLGESNLPAVVLRADPRGHFLTGALINGRETRAVVDTGATEVALNASEAARLGIVVQGAPDVRLKTAGGEARGHRVRLARVQVGNIAVDDVAAVVVAHRDSPEVTLLGMSFLSRLDMQRSGDTLTLSRRR
jgi:aspartyl protease family protein